MLIIPAIDIKDRRVVRLFQGDYSQEKVYSLHPLEVALDLEKLSLRRIHIVDLDAAKEGFSENREIIKEIAQRIKIDIEVGGGIRDEDIIQEYLNSGIKYAVIGTQAYLSPEWFKTIVRKYKENIILAVDVREGKVKIRGWQESFDRDFLEMLDDFSSAGLDTVIYTDISGDGTLEGINLETFTDFLNKIKSLKLKVIFSGGISSREDLMKIKNLNNQKVFGVIIGKAYYENKINLSEFPGGIL